MSFIESLNASTEWRNACGAEEVAPDLTEIERYIVDDIAAEPDQPRQVILLLESPHTLEACRGFPLAGTSGLAVAKHLRSVSCIPEPLSGCPLGDILRHHRCHDRLRSIGVKNVSQLPMQSSAYLCGARLEFHELFRGFRTIRNNPKAETRGDLLTQQIECLLVLCLKSRILESPPSALWILCGNVAKEFFRKASRLLRDARQCCEVPHPSNSGWGKPGNGAPSEIRSMTNRISTALDP